MVAGVGGTGPVLWLARRCRRRVCGHGFICGPGMDKGPCPTNMNAILWTAIAYLCGSVPFAVWLGRLLLGKDIRRFGDGNPGGTNVIRAGGRVLASL